MSDFWEKIAANPSSHLLTGAMDSHLSGKAVGESFEGVRALTDGSRAAKALDLSTAAGTKVSFAGELGAYLTYDDVPPKGSVGEVVNVKSANGDITNHDGKVFVQWDDGKFRAIHAEHLRLASREAGRGVYSQMDKRELEHLILDYASENPEGFWQDGELQMSHKDAVKHYMYNWRRMSADAQRRHYEAWFGGGSPRYAAKKTADLKADFEKIKALAEKRPDSKFLKSVLKQMADKGFAPTDKQLAVVKKIEGEVKEMASMQKQLKSLGKKAAPRWIPPDPTFTKVVVWASKLKEGESATAWDVSRELGVPPLGAGHALESLVAKGVLKKDRKYYSKKADSASQDENDIGDGGIIEAPKDEKETLEGHFEQRLFKELREMVEKDQLGKAAFIRVASLGDLSDFLKVAEGVLIHKSTNDLWSFSKDADGAFLVSRLFDDNGSPLQG